MNHLTTTSSMNTQNTRITPERYSQLQHNPIHRISNSIGIGANGRKNTTNTTWNANQNSNSNTAFMIQNNGSNVSGTYTANIHNYYLMNSMNNSEFIRNELPISNVIKEIDLYGNTFETVNIINPIQHCPIQHIRCNNNRKRSHFQNNNFIEATCTEPLRKKQKK
eukprot:227434_1